MSLSVIPLRPIETCQPEDIKPPVLSSTEQDELLPGLRALADPSRLAMLALIAAQDQPICACDIGDRFDLRQPTIAHHLRVLREAGLITADKRGVWVHYALDRRGYLRLQEAFARMSPAIPAESAAR